jgi:arylsulfatase
MNILQIISDQHMARLMGCEGDRVVITPHMDRLAREGVRFSNAYTQNPICTPSRTSILSGQYCHNHGYYGLGGHAPQQLPSFLGHFKRAGYRTAALGKLHLPNHPRDWAADDCDYFGEFMGSHPNSAFNAHARALGYFDEIDHGRIPEIPGNQQWDARPSRLTFDQSIEGFTVSEAIRFMDEAASSGRKFCIQVSLFRPHQCYTPAKQFWDLYADLNDLPPMVDADVSHRPPHFQKMVEKFKGMKGSFQPDDFLSFARRLWRGYLACITHVDHGVGLLLDYLDRTGRASDTAVVYHSDHGAYSGLFGIGEKAPGICSEAVCRVPMIWRVPGVSRAGHVSSQLVENIDLATTFASVAGTSPFTSGDGVDITPLLQGEDRALRSVSVTENPWSKALRWDRWRFVHYQPEMFDGQDVGELYDISTDPDETKNLYHSPEHAPIVEKSRRLLLEWLIRSTRIATAFTPNSPTSPATAKRSTPPARPRASKRDRETTSDARVVAIESLMPTQPNILLLMTDQHRGDCLGVAGHPVLRTAHLDSLAAGTRFSRAYSACPVCIPARRTLLTGRSAHGHGVYMLTDAELPYPTLPGQLQRHGYQTHLVGKLHLWPRRKMFGFESADWADSPRSEPGQLHNDYQRFLASQGVHHRASDAHGIHANGWTVRPWHLDERFHFTNWCAERAVEFLERRDPTRPFFMKVSFLHPHQPLTPPRDYLDLYRRKSLPPPVQSDWSKVFDRPQRGLPVEAWRVLLDPDVQHDFQAAYYASIHHIDDQIGRILQNIPPDTIVLFTSDHGEMLGDHQWMRKRVPYEGSTNIPMLLRLPGESRSRPQRTIDQPVELMDVMPTLLDAAGVPIPETVEGRSLLPLLRGDTTWRSHLHCEIADIPTLNSGMQMLTDGRQKFIHFPGTGQQQFFDLTTDPHEQHDLVHSPAHAEIIHLWRTRLIAQLKDRPEGFVHNHTLRPLGGPTAFLAPHLTSHGPGWD